MSAPEGRYSRNLAFAQGIKGIGSTASTWLVTAIGRTSRCLIFKSMDWRGAFPIFCILMAVAFVSGGRFVNVKEAKADVPPSIGSSLRLLSEPIFLLAVSASSFMSVPSHPWAGFSSPR
jgi:FHS family L-fucose permease-like MFS transporter